MLLEAASIDPLNDMPLIQYTNLVLRNMKHNNAKSILAKFKANKSFTCENIETFSKSTLVKAMAVKNIKTQTTHNLKYFLYGIVTPP